MIYGKVTLNYEQGRMWKEAALAYFNLLWQYLSGDTEEDHEEL
jgi:hypothetical protein